MNIKSIVVGSLAVYLGAVTLFAPLGAQATWRTHHASLCHHFNDSWSTTCGAQYDWITGNGQAYPDVATWNDAFDYGYLYNWVTNNSRIYGYSIWQ